MRKINKAAILFITLLGLGTLPRTTHAQTAMGLRAVSDKATYAAGDQMSVSVYLDVTSLAAGDNYTAARFYLAYVQNPSSGSIPSTSLFAATPTVTTFTGAGSQSGFSGTGLNNSSAVASSGGASYVGFAVSENSGSTPRTDTGSFLLATATGTLRSDAAAGSYSYAFEDFGAGLARTFVTGKFGPSNAQSLNYPTTLSGTPLAFMISSGASATPEPSSSALLFFVLAGGATRVVARRKRNPAPHKMFRCEHTSRRPKSCIHVQHETNYACYTDV